MRIDMQVHELSLPEIKILTPKAFGDERGHFVETFNRRAFAQAVGLAEAEVEFVQDNQSLSVAKGTLRGLHYQAPPFAQGKLVRVLAGRIFDVALDFRRGSPTFGRWAGAEISAAAGNQIWVPPGFLHGFLTLEPDTVVAYKVTAFYDKASDGAVRWSDPSIGIVWPDPGAAIVLSEKDAAAPLLSEITSPFD